MPSLEFFSAVIFQRSEIVEIDHGCFCNGVLVLAFFNRMPSARYRAIFINRTFAVPFEMNAGVINQEMPAGSILKCLDIFM